MKGNEIDMSPEALSGRLREVSDLWRLWNVLRTAQDMGPVEAETGSLASRASNCGGMEARKADPGAQYCSTE